MTWEIFLGIVALIGFLITVMTPLLKLNKVMTELNCSVDGLKQLIADINSKNSETHKRIWEHNVKQDGMIDNHERRITKIEYDIDKYHNYHPDDNHDNI